MEAGNGLHPGNGEGAIPGSALAAQTTFGTTRNALLPANVYGAAAFSVGDVDGDGDLDVVVGNDHSPLHRHGRRIRRGFDAAADSQQRCVLGAVLFAQAAVPGPGTSSGFVATARLRLVAGSF